MNHPLRTVAVRIERISDVFILSRLTKEGWIVVDRTTEIDWIYEQVEALIHTGVVDDSGR